MKPWVNPEGETHFGGWARMSLPISAFSVVEVGQPKVGENKPSRVRADISVDMNVTDRVKSEWEGKRLAACSLFLSFTSICLCSQHCESMTSAFW